MTGSDAIRPSGMRYYEFVVFLGFGIAVNAFSIDAMLPALPDMALAFELADPKRTQITISLCLLGMGVSQLVYGPLADRFGRKPMLLSGLVLYLFASAIACFTSSFEVMLAARFAQGAGAGATRVICVSMARDNYNGDRLASLMALVTFVWVSVPAIAPFVGQFILMFASWRWIFGVMALMGLLYSLWAGIRMKESLLEEHRRPINPSALLASYMMVLSTRSSLVCLLALAMLMGPHLGFIISAPAIFIDLFGERERFALFFALASLPMGASALINSKLVMRFGARRLVLVGLSALVAQNGLHILLIKLGFESLQLFVIVQMANMFVFSFVASSLTALAMEPLGHVAGTASSFVGFFPAVSGAVFGSVMGQSVDNSVLPVALMYASMGALSLILVFSISRIKSKPQDLPSSR